MSLKFAALGGLTFRRPLGTRAQADDQTQNLESARSYEPILITFGWRGIIDESREYQRGVMKWFWNRISARNRRNVNQVPIADMQKWR